MIALFCCIAHKCGGNNVKFHKEEWTMKKLMIMLLLVTAAFAYTGCKEKSDVEKAQDAAEEAAEEAQEGLKDLMDR
jgi:hypothetical protein